MSGQFLTSLAWTAELKLRSMRCGPRCCHQRNFKQRERIAWSSAVSGCDPRTSPTPCHHEMFPGSTTAKACDNLRRGWRVMDTSRAPESFRSLLLRHRGRTGLIQRDLATRAGVSLRSVQDWEAGVTPPTAERLQALLRALLEARGLTPGRETSEARELWAAVEREARRMNTPFDEEWFAGLLAHAPATSVPASGDVLNPIRAA